MSTLGPSSARAHGNEVDIVPLKVHLISGLPRSGSTLLTAILKQNVNVHAGIQSPLADMIGGLVRIMSNHESELFLTDSQRCRVLRSVVAAYYADLGGKGVIFDSSRTWSQMLPLVTTVMPTAWVFCCVRNPAWIVDSYERIVQRNALRSPRIFQPELGNVFSRAESLLKTTLGGSLNGLKQAWFGSDTNRLVLVRYDSLVSRPAKVIASIYDLIGEPSFSHDFLQVDHDEPEFDARLGLPGLHRVSGPVQPRPRETILPPELFNRFADEFWNGLGKNPRNVQVL